MLMDSELEALCECQAAKANLELCFSCCITQWVQPINGTEEEAKMVTKETHRGVIS
jgi:hypothetical protein